MDEAVGKKAEIGKIVDDYSYLIKAAIRKTCPSIGKLDLDDIEQEVKISVWRQIQKSETEIRNLGSYIWRVTFTTTSKFMKRISQLRKGSGYKLEKMEEAEDTLGDPKILDPEDQFQKKELMDIITRSVNSLIESRRQVLKLYIAGFTVSEITEYFGWSDAKARNLLSRGILDLKKALSEKGIEYEE